MNDFELRRQLRELQVDRPPQVDLWPGIEARLHAPARRRPIRGWLPFALAASVAVLAVALTQRLPERAPAQTGTTPTSRVAGHLPRTADGLDLEYRAALASLPVQALPRELQATAYLLEDSAAQLRSALSANPDSLYLLDQLRRVYARRLDLGRTTLLS